MTKKNSQLKRPNPDTAKCEDCGKEKVVVIDDKFVWPDGWFQTGRSKYGHQYSKAGYGWYCPTCSAQQPKAVA